VKVEEEIEEADEKRENKRFRFLSGEIDKSSVYYEA
jgi:hypothetical protein